MTRKNQEKIRIYKGKPRELQKETRKGRQNKRSDKKKKGSRAKQKTAKRVNLLTIFGWC